MAASVAACWWPGLTGPNLPVRDYPVEAQRQAIDVNLNGLFYCNQAALQHLERNGCGRIVNIASIAGKEGNPNASAYSTSKAGVIGFTKSLAKEVARTEIRVTASPPSRCALRSSTRCRSSTSTSCCPRSPSAVSGRSRRWHRLSAGWPAGSAPSAPVPCSTSPAAGRPHEAATASHPTAASRGCEIAPAAHRKHLTEEHR